MLCGMPPYYSTNKEVLYSNIKNGALKLPASMSDNAKDLIVQLLNRNPITRLGAGPTGAEEIKEHPFFKGLDWNAVIQKKIPL